IGAAAINGTGNALANVLTGNAAANVLAGGAGDDTYVVDSAADTVVESAGAGVDLVQTSIDYTLGANLENVTIAGTGAVNVRGNGLANMLRGNAAANTLDGGAGADAMLGAGGDDLYVVDNVADVVTENPDAGADTVRTSVSYALAANVENLTLLDGAVTGAGNGLNNTIVGNSAANTLEGRAGDDTYVIDSAADLVVENPNEGVDTVRTGVTYTLAPNVEKLVLTGSMAADGTGNALNNVLAGNAAANRLAGDRGDDTYLVYDTADTLVERAGEGVDTVESTVTYTLGANVENLTLAGAGAIDGTGNELDNVIAGNAAVNRLTGSAGNDMLDGAAGADSMLGGTGNDIYVVDNAADSVVEKPGEGTDTVRSSIGYTLGADVENLVLTGAAAINGLGNGLANAITGNAAANVLNGAAGDDTLDGGAGADTLTGAAGNDLYVVDNAGDTVVENPNDGVDTVRASITLTLAANVENLALTGTAAIDGKGNDLNNDIGGNDANNTLDGGRGTDTLRGGRGDDAYEVDNSADVVLENANAGLDVVRTVVTYTLPENVENLVLVSFTAIDGTGNALDNVVAGNSLANVLRGAGGNDRLDGGGGADTLIGGPGNDTYELLRIRDTLTAQTFGGQFFTFARPGEEILVEQTNEGRDTVVSRTSHTLRANIEALVLTDDALPVWAGTAEELLGRNSALESLVEGVGNDLANTLNGGAKNNRLNGLGGADTLFGGAGDDIIDGGDGNDFIDGGPGSDSMDGGAGDDTFIVDRESDATSDSGGFDVVLSSTSYKLGSGIENLTLTGNATSSGKGNAESNLLTGNDAANTLFGGTGGVDTLRGGAGDDTYYVYTGFFDGVVENSNQGIDTVVSEGDYTLGANLEKLVLAWDNSKYGMAGSRGWIGRGNALDNEIVGTQSAGDTLLGEGGNDLLKAVSGARLDGGIGNDVMQAAVSGSTLTDVSGNNLLHDGAGWNSLTVGDGNDLLIAGRGDDTITTGAGRDVIGYNRGDGADVVNASAGADNTVSLGGGIRYADMTLNKVVNDLVLGLGAGDSITFKDWYAAPANRSVLNMQLIAEAMADFNAASADPLRNRKVETFNFANIANAFDASGVATAWALTDTLLRQHLASSSDTAAIGADVAYRYGRSGSLAGMGFDPVVGMLSNGAFGASAQALQGAAATDVGAKRLM
ncbi:MAG TPA: calcium-binding protein, partial [Burkholderiales bacterium]|nr:calcium-binding protein [Burkholderiales bacterium]